MDPSEHEAALVEDFLRDPSTWEPGQDPLQIDPLPIDWGLLELLSGDREGVLLATEIEQRELADLGAALDEWEQRLPKLTPALSARIRGLRGGAHVEEHVEVKEGAPGVRLLSESTRRKKRTTARLRRPARKTSTRRVAGSTRAAAAAGSARVLGQSGQSARRSKRRTNPSLRIAAEARRQSPQAVLGFLAAAAGFLVALAAALHLAAPSQAPGPNVAKLETVQDGPRGPLVSDLQGKQPQGTDPLAPAPADPTGEPAEVERPAVSPEDVEDPRDPDPTHEPTEPAPSPGAGTQVRQPATPAASPTPEGGKAVGSEPAPAPRRWEGASDDGGRLALDLRRLNGSIALARRGEEEFKPLARKAQTIELAPGDRLRSKSGGFVSLDQGGYEVCLDGESEILLRGAASGPRLALAQGRMHCEVRSLPSGERFTIATDQGDLSVLGTIFAVEAQGQQTRVLVQEGTVALAGLQGREVKVGAGQTSTVHRGAPEAPTTFRPRELAWARRFAPRRQLLYAVDFDDRKLGGFSGELARDAQGGSALVLAPCESEASKPYWGLSANVPQGRIAGFRPGPDVYVQFSVFVEDAAPVLFQTYSDRQKKEFKAGFHHPGGYWRTFTVPLLALSTYVDPGKNPVQQGDLFVDLEVYVGKAGSTQRVLLDDVQIYRRVYR